MTIKILLSVSEFKKCGVAGISHFYSSVSSLHYVKQVDNESCVSDLSLEQNTFDYSEVFSREDLLLGHKNAYDFSKNSQCISAKVAGQKELCKQFSFNEIFNHSNHTYILNVDAP